MDTTKILMYGGGAFLLYKFFIEPKSAPAGQYPSNSTAVIPTSQAQTLVPGAPAPPAQYSDAYYIAYQYPAMLKANPNLTNPNYSMTDAEANQYMNNYLDIKQYANAASTLKKLGTAVNAARKHWHDFGVSERRTFLPLMPQYTQPFVPAQSNSNSSGGGSFLTSALGVATTILGFLGDGDLNDMELQLLFNGGAVLNDLLPMFYDADPVTVTAILKRNNEILTKYSQ